MFAQIVRPLRPAAARKVSGACDNDQAKRRREPHRDHVGGDELAHADSGVEPLGHNVDELRVRSDLHFDLGIGLAEGRNQGLEQDRHRRARRRKTQQPSRALPKVARDCARGDKLLEGGLCPGKKSRARFREPHASRRTGEQRRADARLERAHGLADCRRRHAEISRRAGE